MGLLRDKVAVVTGASSGLGFAIALRFVEEGAFVIGVGRRASALQEAAIRMPRNFLAIEADVANLNDIDRVYSIARDRKGVVDVVVANAGLVEPVMLADVTPAHFDRTFNLNARGAFFTAQKAVPLMVRGGSIVFIASGVHLKGLPALSTYAASKAAVRSFARSFAAELSGLRIRVNTISPGPIDTPMLIGSDEPDDLADAKRRNFAEMTPIGRIGRPEEIASAALFLASEASSFSTGIDLVADGGITQL